MSERIFKTRHAWEAFMSNQRGGVWHTLVMHDEQCSPTACRCKPWYRVEKATPENIAEGQRLSEQWAAKCRN